MSTSVESTVISLLVCGSTKVSLRKILDHLSISRSHAFRIISELNKILNGFTLSFISDKQGYYSFVGPELYIRTFIFNFVNQCVSFNEWIFSTSSYTELQSKLSGIFKLPRQKHSTRQLINFIAIFQIRIRNRKYLPVLKDQKLINHLEDFRYLPEETINKCFSEQNIDASTMRTESLYLSFLARIFLYDSLPKDDILGIGAKFLNSPDPDHQLINHLFNQWAQERKLDVTPEQINSFMYHGILLYTLTLLDTTLLQLWNLKLPTETDDTYIDKNAKNHILHFYKQFIKQDLNNSRQSFWLSLTAIVNFCSLLYLYTFQCETTSIKIYFYFTKSFNSQNYLLTLLKKTFSSSLLTFVESSTEANLVITDRLDYISLYNQKVFIISDSFSKEQLNILFQLITEYVLT
ncbi:helix-turn-helix domain-containing protein [Enterococcus raffinosus]|uniref:Helix-turn-helix domain-containing protein n=1 Tax=Enterococcus raffinosus TaxID=71452 RepID=A0AAW8TAP5_9ENTE|nr:helix-turn-helix domain-containing protein [Enterococcus raffinosus]MDT2523749.1 helix-turn-helix domain-containing protein [Enterococcus raffinosus]MDT2534270.1 helix-turn-helix domain-containing protein [Enterococcus raffinosus]MDT2544886.1 helix-turn-helix domain-containing protein [Enterococcus raffinosus]MDT2556832.1 helix-turn-helix domain-containing protein [Enterococcus raffinosus]MDT2577815.1 helix-turn-helix domain-containing protein [Enterococcus raffinosus]